MNVKKDMSMNMNMNVKMDCDVVIVMWNIIEGKYARVDDEYD